MTLLATQFKESTKVIHSQVGRSKFLKYFFKGEVSLNLYGRFLISLYHVYSTLERELEKHKNNPQVALIYFPEELSRLKSLMQDIEFFNGPDWREMLVPITPAQQAYISAIERCSNSSTPELLIAHSYVRYLGDLSGGQLLIKRLQKFNNLPEGKGAAFYQFGLIEDADVFKDMYRKRLNQVDVTEELRNQIVDEVMETYLRNIDIFQEFDCEFEGKPMTEEGHEKELEKFSSEKKALMVVQDDSARGGLLGSWYPSNLWNSLVAAVSLPFERAQV
ncbi:heme oxygenase-domain-containing protein [Gamsiella multidivaricata]|uniref:heme oxygenase-domain-containing protein n=1 Tax=Gamsiella multidivaricata TaxID=101098 RepID=UPI00221FBDA4|nr:heme oxygenase-domain-containing protein [Gamsiella multidivaricata]KAG0370097.1 heme oxygenase (decycling) 1 [Gamsiella multidivaricata]KAI7821095.1 heme oxygenase-domain-containing protein [Gamsiella multidivaricata]